MVADDLLSHNNRSLIIIKSVWLSYTLHLLALAVVYQINHIYIISLGTETDPYFLSCLRVWRTAVIIRTIAKQCLCVQNRSHIQDILHFFHYICIITLHNVPLSFCTHSFCIYFNWNSCFPQQLKFGLSSKLPFMFKAFSPKFLI